MAKKRRNAGHAPGQSDADRYRRILRAIAREPGSALAPASWTTKYPDVMDAALTESIAANVVALEHEYLGYLRTKGLAEDVPPADILKVTNKIDMSPLMDDPDRVNGLWAEVRQRYDAALGRAKGLLAQGRAAEAEAVAREQLLAFVPCFEECCITFTSGRDVPNLLGSVIWLKVGSLTRDALDLDVAVLSREGRDRTTDEFTPILLARVKVEMTGDMLPDWPGATFPLLRPVRSLVTATDIYSRASYKTVFREDERKQALWWGVARTWMRRIGEACTRDDPDQTNLLIYLFSTVMTVNEWLKQGRLTRPKAETREGAVPTAHVMDIRPSDARRVRAIGPVRILSERPPRAPTERTVRTYRTAAWTRRGFVRTYRSGKTAYVAPTTCHRKCADGGARPAPVTLMARPPALDPANAGTTKGGGLA